MNAFVEMSVLVFKQARHNPTEIIQMLWFVFPSLLHFFLFTLQFNCSVQFKRPLQSRMLKSISFKELKNVRLNIDL